ncbi:M1 family metallopeptidase [Mangrovimonas spongiae]|uniref:Aminopeptidase N n=1 Tax=Mangrovimonas spongiae TaxID=2494697 RepID=A0A428K1Y1_9FLAO|nr:M1 family metallopeptidase [Mangrovimonas spongiae]RSK40304.1 M1 family peptidase [Mangrovimonas spongiae]
MKQVIVCLFFIWSIVGVCQQTEIVDFKHLKANLSFNTEESSVMGELVYRFKIRQATDSIYIDAISMLIDNVKVNNQETKWYNDDKKLWIINDFKTNTTYNLTFTYQATPKKALYFVGWDSAAPNQIWTQGQGKYTSNWLPSIDDTNDKIEFDLNITFDKEYDVVANGNLVEKKPNNDATITWIYNMNNPMPSYLVALVVGKYNKKLDISASGIPLEMYFYPKDSNKVEPTYRYTKQMFNFLEEEIGKPYPWQNYKQIPVHDFLYAGMENTSATIFSDAFVVDSIAFNDRNYINVNAHELAHQWFGDLVTAKSGEHHWLQEGFATYYALLAEKSVFGEQHYYWQLYQYYQELVTQDRNSKGTSLLNPKSSSLTFYKRGCWVLHALRKRIGDLAFKKAVKTYLNKYQFKNATTSDFILEAEQASGEDLSEFVTLWIKNKPFPETEAKALLMQSTFIQEYEMADCETVNSKCAYYLESGISDQAKAKIVRQVPHLVTSETFKNAIEVRQAIAESVSKIPLALKSDYETLLNDASYKTKEAALYHLWLNFPDEREVFFNKTRHVIGDATKNVRLLWLVLALSSPEFEPDNNMLYYNELVNYTSSAYNYELRISAFQYLEVLKACNNICQENLNEATKHHNWRMVTFAKDLKKRLTN